MDVFASVSLSKGRNKGKRTTTTTKEGRGLTIEKPDHSKPVSFVRFMPKLREEIDCQGDEEERKKKDEDDKYRYEASIGLNGFGSSFGYSDLGFSPSSFSSKLQVQVDDDDDEEEEEDEFWKMIKERADQRTERVNGNPRAGNRRSLLPGGHVGVFERHIKGIGMKLLEKMGYKGGGLGKKEQGIVAPIEVKIRPKHMGIGFNDYHKEEESKILRTSAVEVSASQQPVVPRKRKEWNKKHAHVKAGANEYEYTNADYFLAQRWEERGDEAVPYRILDMRRPQPKVLTSLKNLNVKFEVKELETMLKNEREIAVALRREMEELLLNEAALYKKQQDEIEEIMLILDLTEQENTSASLTLDSLAGRFEDLQNRFAKYYKLYNLSSILCNYAWPLFIEVFKDWNPLENPSYGTSLMSLWKDLLQGGDECTDFSVAASPYAQLLMEIVLPAVKTSAAETWQPSRDPNPMLFFLETWRHLLPLSVRESILDDAVMPELSKAIGSWDPCEDNLAVHSWVHPWLPLLHEKLERHYPTILYKLGMALQDWHPSDVSAFTVLNPWKTVFDPASWEKFILRAVLPKLYEVMQDFQINRSNQRLGEFNWVKIWASAVPIHHMVNLFESLFFSKWLRVLYQWLNANPSFAEVEHWYRGWKSLIPQEILASERIQAQLNMAMSMMLQAVEGVTVTPPGIWKSISFLQAFEQRQFQQQQEVAFAQKQASMGVGGVSQINREAEMSLIEVISAYAEEHDLLFIPKPGRYSYGHQIYGFGSVSILVDSLEQNIFALNGEHRSLVTLEQLLQMQSVSGPKGL